jgi:mono/diheme cytochrome c family protein
MNGTWVGYFILLSAAIISSIGYAEGAEKGKADYINLCASCHGTKGKGDGPVAKYLSKAPADLTKLSDAHNGIFPSERVFELIDGRREVGAHGTREMPVWGRSTFLAPARMRAKFREITHYISMLRGSN